MIKYIIKDVTYPGLEHYVQAVLPSVIYTSNRREDAKLYEKAEVEADYLRLITEIPECKYKILLAEPREYIPEICHSTEEGIFSAMQGGTD